MTRFNIIKSFLFAFKGLKYSIFKERNIQIQIIIAIEIFILLLLLKIPKIESAIIVFICFFVIILEMLNTSIEKLIDKICPHFDIDYGKIKDILAGVVLLAAILSIIIGIIILYKPFISFLKDIF